jgi:thioredoxin reductase (NADPH)
MIHTQVAIIGSGPAGLTAAIYAARANLEPVVVEGWEAGGQLNTTTDVENYPGFPQGIQGPDLMKSFREQAARFGTRFLRGDIVAVDLSRRPFTLKLEDDQIVADALIVATGARAKMLGLAEERTFLGHGLSTCATCDGFFYRGQEIGVVGGGDSAIEEAIFLTRFATKVHLIHRRDQLRASKIMQDRARANPKIEFHWNQVVAGILGNEDGTVRGAVLEDTTSGKRRELAVHGIFVAIGHVPNTGLFQGLLNLDSNGYVKLNGTGTRTNIEGVFACGDVADSVYRQAVTAAGTGCQAAIDAERWLESTVHATP